MSHEHAAALSATKICRMLSGAEIDAIAGIVEARRVAAGQALFVEDDLGDGFYLIVSGEVEVVKRAAGGERSLARLAAGDVLGEMSLITREPRSATGRALVETSVLRLPAPQFRALVAEGSPAALKVVAGIAEVLARRLAAMTAKVIEFADKSESGRSTPASLKDEKLAELHRTLQIWSF